MADWPLDPAVGSDPFVGVFGETVTVPAISPATEPVTFEAIHGLDWNTDETGRVLPIQRSTHLFQGPDDSVPTLSPQTVIEYAGDRFNVLFTIDTGSGWRVIYADRRPA